LAPSLRGLHHPFGIADKKIKKNILASSSAKCEKVINVVIELYSKRKLIGGINTLHLHYCFIQFGSDGNILSGSDHERCL